MSETFDYGGCDLEISSEVLNISNDYLNTNSGEILHQCQIENCMQFFPTQNSLFEHGNEAHPNVEFYEETFVILSEPVADNPNYENSTCPSEKLSQNSEIADLEKLIDDVVKGPWENLSNETHTETILICENCGKKILNTYLEKHLKKCLSANKERPFQCVYEDCKAKFTTKDHKRVHENSVHNTRVKCPYENCVKFYKPAVLNGHIRRVHFGGKKPSYSETENRFPCLYGKCRATFPSKKRVREHLRTVHQTPKKCPYDNCDCLVKPANLKHHIRGVHEKLEKQCGKCKKMVSINNFYNHCKNCIDDQNTMTCSHKGCNASFTSVEDKQEHLNTVHLLRVKCVYENCNKFIKPSGLSVHIKAIHKRVKKQCIKCQKWMSHFSFAAHYKRCTSNGRRTFRCDHEGCDATFTTAANKLSHVCITHKKNNRS